MLLDTVFTDLTVVSEDYIEIKAHRIVFSSASTFFNKVLTKTGDNQAVVFLGGISGEVLKHIINFIYLGEINIPCSSLNNFLVAANKLQLDGLESLSSFTMTENAGMTNEDDIISCVNGEDILKGDNYEKVNAPPVLKFDSNPDPIQQTYLNEEMSDTSHLWGNIVVPINNQQSQEKFERYSEPIFKTSDVQNQLSSTEVKKKRPNYHVKIKCNLCDHMATKANLRVHVSSKHDFTKFHCDQCIISFTTANGLKTHIKSKHEYIIPL